MKSVCLFLAMPENILAHDDGSRWVGLSVGGRAVTVTAINAMVSLAGGLS